MLGFVDVILRVPPIFIIDEILKISMGLPFNTQTDTTMLDSNQISIMETSDSILVNNNISSSSSSHSISHNGTNSSNLVEQLLNGTTDTLFGGATMASVADDTEFYKILSLTSLKFFSCLLGK